jgi:hypothetical protein
VAAIASFSSKLSVAADQPLAVAPERGVIDGAGSVEIRRDRRNHAFPVHRPVH